MSNQTPLKRILKLLVIVGLLALTASIALAQSGAKPNRGNQPQRPLPGYVQSAKLDAPVTLETTRLHGRLNNDLVDRSGPQKVVVRLTRPSLSEFVARGGRAADESAALDAISAQQDAVIAAAGALDANVKVLARTRLALNAVILEIDAAALKSLAADPNVTSINPVVNYELDLSETVPYIGATAVQDMGFDGSGVKVAVLDSGIDYTHAALGGSGDPNDYADNDPTIIEEGTFPTDKVVGGYDFTGSDWPNAPEAPDPDPLDDGPEAGHGTHVADIIGGELGVAPGADLYAVKVCSSVSTSCSGIALIQAMDYILDPNEDGDMDDRMDVVNMSLGSNMGNPIVDDLSQAVENASGVGVLTVASAGNGGDLPYIHGTPASAPSALAVAQTAVPSDIQPVMEVTQPASIAGQYPAVFQPWSAPLASVVTGDLIYGDSDGDNLDGCSAFTGNVTNRIVLVDRGSCNFSLKISNISQAGAKAGIIGLVAPGDPFTGGDGGDRPIDIPGFMISLAAANTLRDGLDEGTVSITFDPASGLPLVGTMVGSSSRGPSFALNQARPDIGAPGASVSAIVGTGTETGPFGGTSGAAPMVTGSAALLMQAYPDRSWAEIKAVLMNTAETEITTGPEEFGGILAPITRIGGGEVRVDRAVETSVAAWDKYNLTGSLSFGFYDIADGAQLSRDVVVYNYSDEAVTLQTAVENRYANDGGGEVKVTLPAQVNVPAMGSTTVKVQLRVVQDDTKSLHPWVMNSGSQAGNPSALTLNEYDGYIRFTDEANPDNAIHMAWHILPRAAGDVQTGVEGDMSYVQNRGKADTYIDTYSLLGVSNRLEESEQLGGNRLFPDLRYVGVQTYPVPADFCGPAESFVMGFAVSTWERQTQAAPTSFEFWLDTDEDGTDDFVVYNQPLAFPGDVRNVTVVLDLATSDATAFFYLDHKTNSANTVLLFCGDQIGMNADDFLTTSMGVTVMAWDGYFSEEYSDSIEGLNVVPLGERYLTVFEGDNIGYVELEPQSDMVGFEVQDFEDQLNETEMGLLWLYGPGAPAYNENKAWILTEQETVTYLPVFVR